MNLPGSEIFTALQTGAIDATEWVGPYNDTAFGLHQAAQYYYHPGWQEPSGALECFVSAPAYESLSGELQGILEIACMAENDYLLAEFNTRNHTSLKTLIEEHGVELRRFPDDVLDALRGYSLEVVEELGRYGCHEREGLRILPGVRRRSQCLAEDLGGQPGTCAVENRDQR